MPLATVVLLTSLRLPVSLVSPCYVEVADAVGDFRVVNVVAAARVVDVVRVVNVVGVVVKAPANACA